MRRFAPVKWSPVEIRYLKQHKSTPVNQLTIDLAKSRSAIKKKLAEIEDPSKSKAGPTKTRHSKIGRRKDCDNIFFRSGWEANVYRLLSKDKKIKLVEYEPTTFSFAPFGILKGTVSYTPDFKITYNNGKYAWIEVKGGWLKAPDKTKIRRFKKFFPDEYKKLLAITPGEKSKTAKFFQEMEIPILWYYPKLNQKYKKKIPHWE